jgi:hypothetical protein
MSEQSTNGTERSAIRGDVFDELPELSDDSAHAAVVDFPWKFDAENGTDRFGDHDKPGFETAPHEQLAGVLHQLQRILVDGAWVFVFADDIVYPEFRDIVGTSALQRRPTLVWDRCTIGMGAYFRSRHTLIIPATVGETTRRVRDRPTVLEATRQDGALREHDYPTGKPPALYRKMLAPPVLEDGERLLEPFCGGAPGAAIAAERDLGYWGVDTNPEAIERARSFFEQQRFGQTKPISDGSGRNSRSVEPGIDQEGSR